MPFRRKKAAKSNGLFLRVAADMASAATLTSEPVIHVQLATAALSAAATAFTIVAEATSDETAQQLPLVGEIVDIGRAAPDIELSRRASKALSVLCWYYALRFIAEAREELIRDQWMRSMARVFDPS